MPAISRPSGRGPRAWPSDTRSAVRHRAAALLARAPRPVQQTWRLLERTGRETLDDRVPGLAAEAALFSLISLPALLIAVLGSLGFIADSLGPDGTAELRRLVLDVPETFLSKQAYAAYSQVATSVLAQGRGSVVSIGILLSLWTGSSAVNRYLQTIAIAYDLEPRPVWRGRLLALGLTIGGLLGAVAVLPPLVVGPRIVRGLAPDAVADATLQTLNFLFWPGIILAVMAGLATVYHVGVPVADTVASRSARGRACDGAVAGRLGRFAGLRRTEPAGRSGLQPTRGAHRRRPMAVPDVPLGAPRRGVQR